MDYLRDKVGTDVKHENYNIAQIPSFPCLQIWTNSNCESLNYVLKMAINWQPPALGELVDKLYGIMRSEYKNS